MSPAVLSHALAVGKVQTLYTSRLNEHEHFLILLVCHRDSGGKQTEPLHHFLRMQDEQYIGSGQYTYSSRGVCANCRILQILNIALQIAKHTRTM